MAKVNNKTVAANGRKKESNCRNLTAKYVPISKWFPNYTKFQAVSDLVAGITLGLTMIPQSIAYAAIAGLTPQYGLYSTFIGGFIYIFLGSIREVSIGPTSLMALLTLEFTTGMPLDFVIILGFLAGCIELAMGLLNLGFLVDFISIPVSTGFTSATAVILIVHQLPHLLGLEYEAIAVIDSLTCLFRNISKIRWTDTLLGISSIVILLSMKTLKDIEWKSLKNNKTIAKGKLLKKILWFLSTGRNVVVVLASTIAAYQLSIVGHEPFLLSGNVTSGLPPFKFPNITSQIGNQTYTFFDMCSHLGSGLIIVPLVAVLTNVAIAKAFASGDLVDASQEMRTLGVCNILGSFVSSMPTCGSFTRSALSSASGVQTPMAGLYSGTMTLFALSFLTPYFHYIPQATLAAVLISAIMFMIDWRLVPLLWKGKRSDAIACLVTFTVCVGVNVKTGLFLGTICNIIYLLFQSARPKISVTECKTHLGDKYLLLKPSDGLQFLEVNYLTQKISEIGEIQNSKGLPVIVDCQNVKGVDYTAIKGMERLRKEFEARNHQLWFMNMKPSVIKTIRVLSSMESLQIMETDENIIECFQEMQTSNNSQTVFALRETNIMNRIKFSEIGEKNDSKRENYDKNKVESTFHNEEKLSLMTSQDHKVEIIDNDLPSATETSQQQSQQPNGTI